MHHSPAVFAKRACHRDKPWPGARALTPTWPWALGRLKARLALHSRAGGQALRCRAGRQALASLVAAALALGLVLPAQADQPLAPYEVSVWARVLFGPDGKPAEFSLVDEARYPAQFADKVKARIARASIRAPELAGRAVSLRSGLELRFTVQPKADGGGDVRLDGIAMGPLPIKRYLASYPTDVAQSGGWQGQVTGVCQVAVDGRCAQVDVQALPGMPDSVRRYARASLAEWLFEPQQVDGEPVPGEYRLTMVLNTLDAAPEDFREDKFQRAIRGR